MKVYMNLQIKKKSCKKIKLHQFRARTSYYTTEMPFFLNFLQGRTGRLNIFCSDIEIYAGFFLDFLYWGWLKDGRVECHGF